MTKSMTFRERIESIPMPDCIAALPRDKRGLPIPYNVLRDEKGIPEFTVNDQRLVQEKCMGEGRCTITGLKLDPDDTWFLGGEQSTLDPRGMFLDPPVCKEAGMYAAMVCPYLCMPNYANLKRKKRLQYLMDQDVLLHDPTVDPERPNSFCLARTDGYVIAQGAETIEGTNIPQMVLLPNKPYKEIYQFRDGEVIRHWEGQADMMFLFAKGMEKLYAHGIKYEQLSYAQRLVWEGRASGVWPWTIGERMSEGWSPV